MSSYEEYKALTRMAEALEQIAARQDKAFVELQTRIDALERRINPPVTAEEYDRLPVWLRSQLDRLLALIRRNPT